MEYLVSIQNTPYYHWQIDLLIKSFQYHNLQDNLVIAVAESDNWSNIPVSLAKHKRIFMHSNNWNYYTGLGSNPLLATGLCLANDVIKYPFTLIHADMVLVNPISDDFEENIIFDVDTDGEVRAIPKIEEHMNNIVEARKLHKDRHIMPEVGSLLTFKDVPLEFFTRAVDWEIFLESTKAAWVLTICEYVFPLKVSGGYYTQPLVLDSLQKNFIHYKHGCPPLFHKKHFFGEVQFGIDPVQTLLGVNTASGRYIQEIWSCTNK